MNARFGERSELRGDTGRCANHGRRSRLAPVVYRQSASLAVEHFVVEDLVLGQGVLEDPGQRLGSFVLARCGPALINYKFFQLLTREERDLRVFHRNPDLSDL